MIDLGRALGFIQQNGTELERFRLHTLIKGQPHPAAADSLAANQKADGGFSPFWAPENSSLDATCFALAQAEALGLDPRHAVVTDALNFIVRRQQIGGSWEEAADLAGAAPAWAKPGDPAAQIYLTANCALWTAFWGPAETARNGAAFLINQLEGEKLPSFLQAQWLASAVFWATGEPESGLMLANYLYSQRDLLPLEDLVWAAVTLNWVAADHPFVTAAAERLLESQASDGRWPAEQGAEQDVHTTLEALRLLHFSGRIDFS